jgi:hypothetical protein
MKREGFADKVEPIDPEHMVRTEDPFTSHEASETIDHRTKAEVVLDFIRMHSPEPGCIGDDILILSGFEDQRKKPISYSSLTGYFAKLERQFLIERTGETRDGPRFGRRQLVCRALSDEERARRQAELDAALAVSTLPTSLALIEEWWNADAELRVVRQREAELRQRVLDLLVPRQLIGKYEAELPNDCKLCIHITDKDTRLSVKKLTDKEVAAKAEGAVVPMTDTDEVHWDDGLAQS